jgi:2-polyprenyl-3-methyl-5-hydroxy-6-metoxy-1,4-benzoquinol methylase
MPITEQEPIEEWRPDELEVLGRCPVCEAAERDVLYAGLTDRIFFAVPGRWTLYQCRGCGVGYLDPRPTPEAIGRAYAKYYTHASTTESGPHSAKARLKQALVNGYLSGKYRARARPSLALGALVMAVMPAARAHADRHVRMLRLPSGGGRLLDVGCGNGDFLRAMRDYGWEVAGLDLDPKAIEACRDRGIEAACGTLDTAGLPEASFDAVTLGHVIEHFHDPIAALEECRRVLKPGGSLFLETPNILSAGRVRWGADWRGLEPPRHLAIFSPKALANACARTGFRVCRVQGLPLSDWMYRQSRAIAEGKDPYEDMWSPIPPEEAARLAAEQKEGVSDPDTAEIFMLLAERLAD